MVKKIIFFSLLIFFSKILNIYCNKDSHINNLFNEFNQVSSNYLNIKTVDFINLDRNSTFYFEFLKNEKDLLVHLHSINCDIDLFIDDKMGVKINKIKSNIF